jgi:sulfoxide reductase catalytic subunit YedY
MLIRRRPSWELPESAATPESVMLSRRSLLAGSIGMIGAAAMPNLAFGAASDDLYPVKRNEAFTLDRPISDEQDATTYNNYYEFGSSKNIWRGAQALKVEPWQVVIDGMVEKEIKIDAHDLIRKMPLEERLYRHRCVERWAMAVPWSGFPLKALVDMAKPTSGAKYLRMETFKDASVASGQRAFWYPWPYVEGLTIEEATNELAFIATGMYGKPIPKQNGAPLRLAVPWKYGFKSIKGIVRFNFTDQMPTSFWMEVLGAEYGFYANVNPGVPHRRWSQAKEQLLGESTYRPTLMYNGYEEQVAHLYKGMPQNKIFY